MSFHLWLLSNVPSALLCFVIIFFYVTGSVIGFMIVRKFYPYPRCKEHNDIAGFIFATLGVVYAVILAFTVVVTWGDYEKADDTASKELNGIASLANDTIAFPPEIGSRIRAELALYVKEIVYDEWPRMDRSYQSRKVDDIQKRIWNTYLCFQPATETQKILLAESVKNMNQLFEFRRQRLHFASTGIHPLLYVIMIVGSVLTIGFTMIFGTQNVTEHVIMTACLAAMIGLTIFTIIALDYPFTGSFSVQPDDFIRIMKEMKS